jgi:hypothetical protein
MASAVQGTVLQVGFGEIARFGKAPVPMKKSRETGAALSDLRPNSVQEFGITRY